MATMTSSGGDFATRAAPSPRPFGLPGQYDENGVDLSLIRANMRVTPTERARRAEHGVEFIIVGGQAEALMGGARVTYDVDLCYRRTPDNLERLATALGTLNLTLRGAPWLPGAARDVRGPAATRRDRQGIAAATRGHQASARTGRPALTASPQEAS